MPLVKLFAMYPEVKVFLIDFTNNIRLQVKAMASADYGLPNDDLIVNAFGVEVLSLDPDAAGLYVEIQTNPGEVETVADEFRDKVLNIIASVYREKSGGEEIEIDGWVQFIPGSWMLMTSAGVVKLHVDHKKKQE